MKTSDSTNETRPIKVAFGSSRWELSSRVCGGARTFFQSNTLSIVFVAIGIMVLAATGCSEAPAASDDAEADIELTTPEDVSTEVVEDSNGSDIGEDFDATLDPEMVEQLEQWAAEIPEDWTLVDGEGRDASGTKLVEVRTEPWEPIVDVFTGSLSLERLAVEYQKCLIAVDGDGMTRVRCHESFPLGGDPTPDEGYYITACPASRYVGLGYSPLYVADSDWSYCLDDALIGPGISFKNCPGRHCVDGRVCEGMIRHEWSRSRSFAGSDCVSAPECLKVLNALSPADRALVDDSCFYSDLTLAETGQPDEQDCDSLSSGECAINCPCPDEGSRGQSCAFLSEEHPVGVCSNNGCVENGTGGRSDRACNSNQEGSACMHVVEFPDYLEDFKEGAWRVDEPEDVREVDFSNGRCVLRERCERFSARYPGVYECAYTED